jgi:ferredoxin--NADP+ reductase
VTIPGGEHRPLRVAIVGSGPSGFYAAESLFRRADLKVHVDMFDRLPTPFGLVRYGVAPDHQKMKAVIKVYEKTASHDRFRFYGNVGLGRDLSVEDLRAAYDQIVYAFGAETDRQLGVPGEDLAGSHSATAFVGWYNGHPDHRDDTFDLGVERAVVFGVGNVAMDVTRVLMRPARELEETDIADYALEALRHSRVREIVVVGRRGAAQAAFSPKEIEELGSLDGVDLIVDPADLELDDATRADLENDTNGRKNMDLLRKKLEEGPQGHSRRIVLRFLASPKELLGDAGRVTGVRLERNRIERGADGWPSARGTGETDVVEAGLVFRAIGYRGEPVPGVPYDDRRGIVPNADGRVKASTDGDVVPCEYVVGWAKRGPTGLIGTNKNCSAATVDLMVEDLPALEARPAAHPEAAEKILRERGARFVTFDDWRHLDALERERGEKAGRIRDRFSRVEEMLEAIDRARSASP